MHKYYLPVVELRRGCTPESIHYGAIAVVDVHGQILASFGDPRTIAYLRSSAKPFQVLPFLENGGQSAYNLSLREIAMMCASHSGTDKHVAVLKSIHAKVGLSEAQLLCGIHPPIHVPTKEQLIRRGEQPTPFRHNCSGKHSSMLAYARLCNQPTTDYINPDHPIQKSIQTAFAEMSGLDVEQIQMGTDGCSAPNFAVPLYNAALAYARLCDPEQVDPPLLPTRKAACHTVVTAMTSYPDMVAGPDRFDTDLMVATRGRILAKGGAEGYQGLGLPPGMLGPGSPATGIAIKIADGDPKDRARPAVTLEVLRALGALNSDEQKSLERYGPVFRLENWRKLIIGEGHPCFELVMNPQISGVR